MCKRLNIGLFIDDIDAVFTREAVKGAELGAIAIDANMYIYPGMYLDGADISDNHIEYEYQYNTLFQFVSRNHIDILYVMMGMIGCRIMADERAAFLEQFLGIPIVNLYTRMEGYPSVIFDNKGAFMKGIRHLITEHHVDKIGYVSGPKTNVDAMERFSAYTTVLEEEGIPYREDYVVYGNFEESSEKVIGELVTANPELEAVVFANDRMAHGGYRAFKKLGLKVGQDLLVISFDNSDFAASLTPPLTTVEANAAELAYRAVVDADRIIQTGRVEDLSVDTHLVMRSSCGCLNFNYQTMSEHMGIENLMKSGDLSVEMQKIDDYLFGNFIEGDTLRQIKDDMAVLIGMLCEMVSEDDFDSYDKDINVVFSQIIAQPIYRYTTVELLTNMLMAVQHELRLFIKDVNKQLRIMELFSEFYRKLAIMNWQTIQSQQVGMNQMSRRISNMTVDMFRLNVEESIPYERALDSLEQVGISSAYLYTFTEPVHHDRNERFERPDRMLLRAYYDGTDAVAVPEDKQLIYSEDILCNEYMPKDRRVTMVLSPLFSDEELYGILVSEIHYEYFRNLGPIAMQISIALKSLMLLEQQERIQRRLEENLAQAAENNDVLKEISKTDQLTGLYNRWGFLDHVKGILANPRNKDKQVLVMYADMDNLKMINDEYGHDEGDYALKEIASILKETFPNSEVVGRFGGDEFVAFAILGTHNYENIIRHKIMQITERHNKLLNKPYFVEMSVGICEVPCSPDLEIYQVLAEADRKLYKEKREKKRLRGSYR
jgi:diguanylate cyclase (GGDEF)-like protein